MLDEYCQVRCKGAVVASLDFCGLTGNPSLPPRRRRWALGARAQARSECRVELPIGRFRVQSAVGQPARRQPKPQTTNNLGPQINHPSTRTTNLNHRQRPTPPLINPTPPSPTHLPTFLSRWFPNLSGLIALWLSCATQPSRSRAPSLSRSPSSATPQVRNNFTHPSLTRQLNLLPSTALVRLSSRGMGFVVKWVADPADVYLTWLQGVTGSSLTRRRSGLKTATRTEREAHHGTSARTRASATSQSRSSRGASLPPATRPACWAKLPVAARSREGLADLESLFKGR